MRADFEQQCMHMCKASANTPASITDTLHDCSAVTVPSQFGHAALHLAWRSLCQRCRRCRERALTVSAHGLSASGAMVDNRPSRPRRGDVRTESERPRRGDRGIVNSISQISAPAWAVEIWFGGARQQLWRMAPRSRTRGLRGLFQPFP